MQAGRDLPAGALVAPCVPAGLLGDCLGLDDENWSSVREIWDRYGADLLAGVALVIAFFAFGIAGGGMDDVLSDLLGLWSYPFG